MALRVAVRAHALEVAITGPEVSLCLSTGVTLPWAEVVGARVVPFAVARAELGWRVGGGYLPGVFATGWYTMPGRRGDRQLWRVYRDRTLLLIDTRRRRPARLVLQHPDRDLLAERINEHANR